MGWDATGAVAALPGESDVGPPIADRLPSEMCGDFSEGVLFVPETGSGRLLGDTEDQIAQAEVTKARQSNGCIEAPKLEARSFDQPTDRMTRIGVALVVYVGIRIEA